MEKMITSVRGNSTLIDLLVFYVLISTGITLLISANAMDARDRHIDDLAHSILNSLLFSTAGDEIGYQIEGYSKNLSGKSWAEIITESAFLYIHEPEIGRKLAENLQMALDRKITSLYTRGFLVALDITSTEIGFSLHAGENIDRPATVVSATLFCPMDEKISLKVEVKIC
ncbi:MAG: hypothetical protein QW626_00895 [Candidatus Hadarchaeales archaeon]